MKNGGCKNKANKYKKRSVVSHSNAIVQPQTVVIEYAYAFIAKLTVFAPCATRQSYCTLENCSLHLYIAYFTKVVIVYDCRAFRGPLFGRILSDFYILVCRVRISGYKP